MQKMPDFKDCYPSAIVAMGLELPQPDSCTEQQLALARLLDDEEMIAIGQTMRRAKKYEVKAFTEMLLSAAELKALGRSYRGTVEQFSRRFLSEKRGFAWTIAHK